jgi:Asp-tRNA(Asn)/Glu-tRNA(Gln) amidotransferase A subunit family amidase
MALERLMAEQSLDALLYPPSAVLPLSMDNPKGGWAPELAACSGWPALVVPTGRAASGLPLSIELLGRAHDEALLFALGRAIEAGTGDRPTPSL